MQLSREKHQRMIGIYASKMTIYIRLKTHNLVRIGKETV